MVTRLRPDSLDFPPAFASTSAGLLAMGGDLSVERLLAAYQQGIFPWFSAGGPIYWWCPDPRFVLFPAQLKVSASMRQVLRRGQFRISFDKDFRGVISGCQQVPRPGQDGTWLTCDMLEAYCELHRLGYAHSVEVWQGGQLVGGLYGIIMGKVFFGESMFAHVSNASKAGFITLVQHLQAQGFVVVDCQVYTEHLASLGAKMVPRAHFLQLLAEHAECAPSDLAGTYLLP
jgi:leucyl/phenylalanyl-tRNA---protein transferase